MFKRFLGLRQAGLGRKLAVLATTVLLAPLGQAGLVEVASWNGLWADKSGEQRLWILRNADSSSSFGGTDSQSTFWGICVHVEPARALCSGEGMTAENGPGSPVRRLTYKSEIRLGSGSLTETWEARLIPLAEDLGKVSAEQLLLKGKTEYTQKAPSRLR